MISRTALPLLAVLALIAAPAAADQEKEQPADEQTAKEKKADAAGDESVKVFTNDDLNRMFPRGRDEDRAPAAAEPDAAARPDAGAPPGAGQIQDPLQRLEAEQQEAAKRREEIAAAEKAVIAAEERVVALEKRLRSLHNPLLARPAKPEDQEDWDQLDNVERVERSNQELETARADVEAARKKVDDLRRQ